MTDARPPITCHVLDTTRGRPAPNLPVTLTLTSAPPTQVGESTVPPDPVSFAGTTNVDGRVTSWSTRRGDTPGLRAVFDAAAEGAGGAPSGPGDLRFELRFELAGYWEERGVEDAFFPEVVVAFVCRGSMIRAGEHWHVPVLVGPFSYTTYRGS